jgi:glycosyltransferase involved in cell wall biosynthesis
MTKQSPLVSVIMTVYNAEGYVSEAIDSILRQDFTDYELILINDGSKDGSQAIVDRYAAIDKRIVPIVQKNMGLVASLNKGINLAKGTYIARMDADDVAMDGRFREQVEFLYANPDVVLVGGAFEVIDTDGCYLEAIFPPFRDKDIRRTMYLRNPFGHASVMYRKQAAIDAGLYSNEFGPTEDFELWIRMARIGKIGGLARPLYRYRVNPQGISLSSNGKQMDHTVQHTDRLWREQPPAVLSRAELKTQARRYVASTPKAGHGVALKYQFLTDNARIGFKHLAHGNIGTGIRQLWNVATTGRAGLAVVWRRLKIVGGGLSRRAVGRG